MAHLLVILPLLTGITEGVYSKERLEFERAVSIALSLTKIKISAALCLQRYAARRGVHEGTPRLSQAPHR